ncbi:MAG: Gfo/Idh/MocA family oxidoreductase [Chthoniobacteraceae bacterium]
MTPHTSRRSFLKTTSAAVLGFPALLRAANPNGNLQLAAIGCAGKGLSDIVEVGSHTKVKYTGFCDVDSTRFKQADVKFPGVPHFADYREMFAKLGDTFDGVIVSTPDHMHAAPSIDAMRRGKHVYCQKPLSHTVWEARQMRLWAAKSKVATQMGNQIHSHEAYRTAVKLVRDGVIGKIKAVHSFQPNAGNQHTRMTAPPPSGPVPETLNWDLWVGAAPMIDYVPDVYHPFKWRDWQHFGNGTMGDFGCHILDPVFTALEIKSPLTIRGANDGLNKYTWPAAETIEYVFPGTKYTTGKTLPVTWYDGGRMPDAALAQMPADKKLPGSGSLLIGEGGVLLIPHVAMPQLYPVEKFASYTIEKVAGSSHYHAWVDSALDGKPTTDNFDYACPLTEAALLGNVATQCPGALLKWDSAKLKISGHADAQRLLTKNYRKGWKIPAA